MAIVLYSGWGFQENRALSARARKILREGSTKDGRGRVAFVPVHRESAREDFRAFQRTLGSSAPSKLMPLPQKRGASLSQYLSSLSKEFDGLFLGGGNTYELLKALRSRGIRPSFLKEFLARGGVIMGLSAGGIVLTPHIATASVPSEDADANSVGLKNRRGLSLLPFEFVPHFSGSALAVQEIQKHLSGSSRSVLACKDGAGIVVRGEKAEVHGGATLFRGGRMKYLPSRSIISLKALRKGSYIFPSASHSSKRKRQHSSSK
jgi:dipeptidase E